MSIASKLFTLAEVSSHNSRKDCWLIIHSKVYNVTKFLEEHPGGEEVMLASTGKDATDDFEDIGHSDSAKALMSKYYVGDIDKATIPAKKEYTPSRDPKYEPDKTSEFIIRLLQFMLPLFWQWLLVFDPTTPLIPVDYLCGCTAARFIVNVIAAQDLLLFPLSSMYGLIFRKC